MLVKGVKNIICIWMPYEVREYKRAVQQSVYDTYIDDHVCPTFIPDEGKGLVAENEDHLSQDDMDDIDEHLAFLSRRFAKLKFKKNFGAARPNRNMKYFGLLKQKERAFITQENDWAADGLDEDEETNYVNLALMAKSDETETSSSTCKKSKEKLESNFVEGLLTDVDSTDDENHPSDNQQDYPSSDKEPHPLAVSKPVSKAKHAKLNEKYGSAYKNFVPGC
ncbi:hypothetical protein AgCh_028339 [Apium graveolens]